VGEVGTIQGHRASRYLEVVLLVDYLFWDKCMKGGGV
jgi:hypothetical protein